jgi:membrane-associated phospholipid phosphatase
LPKSAAAEWGLELIRTLQAALGPTADIPFLVITSAGAAELHFVLLLVLLWCVEKQLGARLLVLFLASSVINAELKSLLALPRPFFYRPDLELAPESGFGMPSAHAQNGLVVWGGLAAWTRRRPLRAGLLLLAVLVGLSRVYLGVHFPQDVAVGWLLGGGLLVVHLRLGDRIQRRLLELPLGWQLRLSLMLPPLLMLLHPDPQAASAIGALSGALAGLALERRYVPYRRGGPPSRRLGRLLLGSLLFVALDAGLRLALPGAGSPWLAVGRYLRFGIIWMAATVGAAWLFRRVGLAEPDVADR